MEKIASYLSIFSVFAPLTIGILNFRWLKANARILLPIVALASVPQALTLVSSKLPVALYNSYIMADLILWPVLFLVSSESRKFRFTLLVLFSANLCFDVAFVLLNFSSERFFYELVCVDSIFQVIYISLFFL